MRTTEAASYDNFAGGVIVAAVGGVGWNCLHADGTANENK